MKSDKSILIIDDDLGIRDGLTVLLQKFFIVESVASGKEATEVILHRKHDIYIIDLFLGDINGFEILALVNKRFPESITIILTGYGSDEDILKAKQLGANEFLHKPISFKQLKTIIDKLNDSKYNFESSEKTIEISYNFIAGVNTELLEYFNPLKNELKFLKQVLPNDYKHYTNNISDLILDLEFKVEFIGLIIKLKNRMFEDTKGNIFIKEVIEKALEKFPNTDIYKRIIINNDDNAYVFVNSFSLLINILLMLLKKFEKSLLKVSKSIQGIEIEMINTGLTIQKPFDSDGVMSDFPHIELNLLKEVLNFINSQFNIKQDGPYTNLLITVKTI
jgi:YesN/AraC family two-component response regulator